jgi:DNA-binding MarR family transcriptional regulator
MPRKPPAPVETASSDNESVELQRDLLVYLGFNCQKTYLTMLPALLKAMGKFKLRPADFSVLVLVRGNPDINQKRISEILNISPPNMATLLDRLEQRGILVRQRNPNDKRSQILVLTPEGLRICNKAEKAVAETEEAIGSVLTTEEKNELVRLLRKLQVAG